MYLAYLDESGDTGINQSPTDFFVLSCVLIHESDWLSNLNFLIDLRRDLRDQYGIPTRPEIKAAHLRRNSGVIRKLKLCLDQRMQIYRQLLAYQAQYLSIKTFAIAIDKTQASNKGWEPRFAAWTFALQRINRFCEEKKDWAMIFPDEGHGFFIRKRIRHMRRYHLIPSHWGPGTIRFEIQRIVEDPNERASHDSYFIQLADWNAYAAHRSAYVKPHPPAPADLWDELQQVLLLDVNKLRGGPPGIVKYP